MFITSSFILFLLFFIYELYSLVDKQYIFSRNGSKLEKYIQSKDLQTITDNLGNTEKHFFSSIRNFYSLVNKGSPLMYENKAKFFSCFISIFLSYISFSISFIHVKFFPISFFGKKLDLVTLLDPYYVFFEIFYYILFAFFLFRILYFIFYYSKKSKASKTKKDIGNLKEVLQLCIPSSEENKNLYIKEKGLYQNILITGSIGSGKTSGAIANILDQLIQKNIGGLYIDVKGDTAELIFKIAKKHHKQDKIQLISLSSNCQYNPLNNPFLSSRELANRIKKSIVLLSLRQTSDAYWLEKSEMFFRDFITLIRAYQNAVNFFELHQLIISKEYLLEKITTIKDNILKNTYTEEELFAINAALMNIQKEYFKLDERTLGIIKSEMTRATNVFVSDQKVYERFCCASEMLDFENRIVVFSIGIGENEVLAKLIATYIKLDFQKRILSRKIEQRKPVFFVCDEYQLVANSEDSQFFSLSREFCCINVVSMQSYRSLQMSLQDEMGSRVIIQNLVNKIWFRNDDIMTVSEIIKQLGKEKTENATISFAESGQDSKFDLFSQRFKTIKSGLSQTYSIADKWEYAYSEKYFTQTLKTWECMCFISDGDSMQLFPKIKLEAWREKDEEKVYHTME